MRVGILGALDVESEGRPVEVGGQRVRALLARLAADAGHPVPVDALVSALWGEHPPADPANSVQSLVSRLRRLLPVPGAVESSPAGYRLALPPDDVDAVRFERLTAEGRRELDADRPLEAAKLLGEALALWHGVALADAGDAEWAIAPRTRWDELRLAALEDRLEADLRLGRHAEVVAELDGLAHEHPLRERLRGLLVRALAGSGRQAEALAAYEETRRALADELGVDPSAELQDLHVAVLRGDPGLRPARPVHPERTRTNLRSGLTSFVGREDDVARIGERLDQARLVTLVGPGGAGKTRLASEAGLRFADRAPDGVWLVELAPVSDPGEIATAALGSLDHRVLNRLDSQRVQGPAQDALTRLVDMLLDRRALLLLDNCEHLVAGAAEFAEQLLGRCPELRVLATSREPLGIFGEALVPLPPLGLPAADATPAEAAGYPAVTLFADRARAVDPGFAVDAETVGPVVEICRRLDGLPLAIELAAARVRTLPVDAVAARLGDRFRLLTGGSRTAVARHQTLRAVVAWSWELLPPAERELTERLAVFHGTITAESARGVLSEPLPVEDVQDLLAVLADKSLLQVAGGGRYRMLETIREFGVERLADRGEIAAVRAAHARFFLALAEEAEPHLRAAEQIEWLDVLVAERDNLLAALRSAADAGDAATAVRIGAALSWYWTLLGQHVDAWTWLEVALEVPGESPLETRAVALGVFVVSALASGRNEEGMARLPELEDMLPRVDMSRHPILLLVEPVLAMLRGEAQRSYELLDRSLEIADPWGRSMLLQMRAAMAENLGDIDGMRATMPEALAAYREVGDRWGIGNTLSALATLQMLDGETDRAIETLEEAVRMLAELRAADDVSQLQLRLAMTQAVAGRLDEALAGVEEAERLAERFGSSTALAFAVLARADLARRSGDAPTARRLAEEALGRLGTVIAAPQLGAIVLVGLAHLDIGEGKLTDAADRLADAWGRGMTSWDMPVVAQVVVAVADLVSARGEPAAAAEVIGAAEAIRGTEDRSNTEARRVVAAAEAALGKDAAGAARARGRALPREAAMEVVLRHLPPVPPAPPTLLPPREPRA